MDLKRPKPRRLLAGLPLALLLAQIGVSVVVLTASGGLDPVIRPDTRSYVNVSRAPTVARALARHRTYAYPLFLKALRELPAEPLPMTVIPKIHAAVFFVAVLVFWFAVRAWSGSAWLALAAATPLISAPVLFLAPRIQPDFPAAGLALIAVSLLLRLARRPRRIVLWILITLIVFATYQARPAYVFLIPFVPAMGWVLRACNEGRLKLAQAPWAAGLALAMVLPFLVFANARKEMVGHFGLVAFTGFNLIGITASFLDDEIIETLPPERRELAESILRQRTARGWEPMTLDGDTRIWQEQFNTNTWRISISKARRMEKQYAQKARQRGESRRFQDIEVNDRLLSLSETIIRQRPHLYLKWFRDGVLVGLRDILRYPWVFGPLFALLGALPIALAKRRAKHALNLRLLGLLLLCGSYAIIHLLLVVVVSIPIDRYLVTIALLVPTALCSLLFSLWKAATPARVPDAA